ncbi:hypothetical protein NQ318_021179 [Aromia moschata]|uniref:Uncharacterized protein n=1 Tax=Aromia moschata TaxID=1265417 RepID=A0AAV8YH88_9CUCU|nr:hypothetical protein NQ318_021179 [Aromia moschata]
MSDSEFSLTPPELVEAAKVASQNYYQLNCGKFTKRVFKIYGMEDEKDMQFGTDTTTKAINNTNMEDSEFPGSRRPIPVSVIDQNSSLTYLTPLSGLDFLADVNQLIIQQSVELADLISNVSSEKQIHCQSA